LYSIVLHLAIKQSKSDAIAPDFEYMAGIQKKPLPNDKGFVVLS